MVASVVVDTSYTRVSLSMYLCIKLLSRFDPPSVPKDFVPHHKFSGPLETDIQLADTPPPEVSPPGDNNMKLLIDGVATLVARCGKLFEDLSREKNRNNPLFSFLNGGNGCDYYARKLWEGRQKHKTQSNLAVDGKLSPMVQKMTAESRGKLLGEKPLERSSKEPSSSIASENAVHIQNNLSDTFTKSASYVSSILNLCPFFLIVYITYRGSFLKINNLIVDLTSHCSVN